MNTSIFSEIKSMLNFLKNILIIYNLDRLSWVNRVARIFRD
jgi:hypothetical protein